MSIGGLIPNWARDPKNLNVVVANGAQEAKELGRVTTLLQETIHDISYGFEEPAMRAEIIPERETESLNRLLDS